jgi:hypothetical protein
MGDFVVKCLKFMLLLLSRFVCIRSVLETLLIVIESIRLDKSFEDDLIASGHCKC